MILWRSIIFSMIYIEWPTIKEEKTTWAENAAPESTTRSTPRKPERPESTRSLASPASPASTKQQN